MLLCASFISKTLFKAFCYCKDLVPVTRAAIITCRKKNRHRKQSTNLYNIAYFIDFRLGSVIRLCFRLSYTVSSFSQLLCALIDNRKKEVSTRLWYSTMGRSATRWLSPFSGVARACAHTLMFFNAVSKRDAVSQSKDNIRTTRRSPDVC